MSQKVTILILFLLQVFIFNCEMTVAATDSPNSQSITFKNPIVDTSKHIRMEYSFTLGGPFTGYRRFESKCGTHDAGETLLASRNTPGFSITSYCSDASGCDPGSGNDIQPIHTPCKLKLLSSLYSRIISE